MYHVSMFRATLLARSATQDKGFKKKSFMATLNNNMSLFELGLLLHTGMNGALTSSVEHGVIVGDSPSSGELADSLKGGSALSEHVHGQRLLTLIDKGDGVINAVHSDNRQDGTKQLLLKVGGLGVKQSGQL